MNEKDMINYYRSLEYDTIEKATECLQSHSNSSSEENSADISIISWNNLENNKRKCKIICGFSPDEFIELYSLIEHLISENKGRGPKSKTSKHDKFLIILCYLKHYETMNKLAITFNISSTRVHSIISS